MSHPGFIDVKCPYCGNRQRIKIENITGQVRTCLNQLGGEAIGCGNEFVVRVTIHTVVTKEVEVFKLEKVSTEEEK